MSRLPTGGLIDRNKPLNFTFDGRHYVGFEGDTLASALIANNVKLVGRSFKYHRKRGIMTAGQEEPNALITLGRGAAADPNTRATTVKLSEGLEAFSQNRFPSLEFDIMAVNQIFAPLFVAGFYYKTFMWPAAFWEKLYEPLIRRAAGLGALSGAPDRDHYGRAHGFCDLLVIGSGPAGLQSALLAARAGLRVMIAEADWQLGGRLLCEHHAINQSHGLDWAAMAQAELAALPNVKILTSTNVFGIYDGCEYGAVQHLPNGQPRQVLWKIMAQNCFLATGAIERPIVFGGNDHPGVMTASAIATYVNRYAASPGQNIGIFTSTDSGWAVAQDLHNAGISVAAIIDPRAQLPDNAKYLREAGIAIYSQSEIIDVNGRPIKNAAVRTPHGLQHIKMDCLAVSGGWNPAIGLGANLGARPIWSDSISSFVIDKAPLGLQAIGAAAGKLNLADILADATQHAKNLCDAYGRNTSATVPQTSDDPANLSPCYFVTGSKTKAFVDFQHDVTSSDITLAAHEGYTSIELMKRYTTLGMATDQGKTSQLNGHALLAAETGKTLAQSGTILSRPPYLPIRIGVLAGHHRDEYFRPERRTVTHDWAAAQGAPFVDAGLWKRAQYFPQAGEKDWLATVNREVRTTRSKAGLCDVSTLGKIDIHGPDAGVFLDRLYINSFSNLPVGRARYGVMLREDGFVMDDGTTTRFAEDYFYLTTTTANAAKIMQHIDYARQVLWPELDVQATSVTEQWAAFALAGPQSRTILQNLLPDEDLGNTAFPYMAARALTWNAMPARLFRLSFSGELAYEIAVPTPQGAALWQALLDAGRPYGLIPYGTEALGVMRIEKGHPAGNELNGQTTAADLGLGRLMSRKKDFIGRALAARPGLTDPNRPVLVGIKPIDRTARLRAGGHLLPVGAPASAENDQGYITSAAYSPTLGHWIALGLLARGRTRHGETIEIHDPVRGALQKAAICDPVFVDPEGEKLRG